MFRIELRLLRGCRGGGGGHRRLLDELGLPRRLRRLPLRREDHELAVLDLHVPTATGRGCLAVRLEADVDRTARQARLVVGLQLAQVRRERGPGGRVARVLQAHDGHVAGDVAGVHAEVGHAGVAGVLLEVGLELLGRLGLQLHRGKTGGHDDFRPEGRRDRLVEERLAVAGGQDGGLHLHAVLGEALHDGDVGAGDERQVDGVGAGVLDAEHLRSDVGAAEVDGGVGVDGFEAHFRNRELLEVLRRRGGRGRDAIGERGDLLGAHRLHELRQAVVGDAIGGDHVAQRGDDVLVALHAVVRAVVAAVDLRDGRVEQELVCEERERGVVHDHEHVLVLHEILRGGLVRPTGLVVDHLHVDLATVDTTRGVLAVDAAPGNPCRR